MLNMIGARGMIDPLLLTAKDAIANSLGSVTQYKTQALDAKDSIPNISQMYST